MGSSGSKSLQPTDFESCEAASDSTHPKKYITAWQDKNGHWTRQEKTWVESEAVHKKPGSWTSLEPIIGMAYFEGGAEKVPLQDPAERKTDHSK